jgi:hypothetical protein
MTNFDEELQQLKDKLLLMASHADSAVARSIRALVERDDSLARHVQEDDTILDNYEIENDDIAVHLLSMAPVASTLRLITVAMKISQNLERVGDEAVKIARHAVTLNGEPQLKPYVDLPRMAEMSLTMLRGALDAFVQRQPPPLSGARDHPGRQGCGQPQRPVAPRIGEFHGGVAVEYFPLSFPHGHFPFAGAGGRPCDQHRGGGRLSLRGVRHPPFTAAQA